MKKIFVCFVLIVSFLLPFRAEEAPIRITLTAVGDCTLGGVANHTASSEALFAKTVDKNGYEWFLQNVRYLFEADDFTLINLEGPLTTAQKYEDQARFYFRGRPSDVAILTCSSVEVATLANNHSHNFREEGYEETLRTLEDAGVGACGYDRVYYAECKGITVGFCGFDQWRSDKAQITSVVTEARKNCDLLIVSYHGGIEKSNRMSEQVREAGRLCIDLGADLVIGNHSHVYGGIERYKGKYITGSLGNFLFGGNADPGDLTCTIFRQEFLIYPDGTVADGGIDILPALVSTQRDRNNYQPCVQEDLRKATTFFNSVMRLSNFKVSDTRWLPDSFVIRNNIHD